MVVQRLIGCLIRYPSNLLSAMDYLEYMGFEECEIAFFITSTIFYFLLLYLLYLFSERDFLGYIQETGTTLAGFG